MNPFSLKPMPIEKTLMDWRTLYPAPYDKRAVDPYTRTRVILMNGTEFEQVWFGHQLSRNCLNNDLRREIALLRRSEQQQQKYISCLKPMDETILEHTIGYEQLAVDLTAALAKMVPCANAKSALDFALLEDFDHLYRYANLLDMETGESAEQLVGGYTEIMPGRPTISEHRHPFDSIRQYANDKEADPITKLAANIITAAEQQTMNYYMNVATLYPTDLGRRLYQEIGMIEEQHVTHYGSLLDPRPTWLESLLMHQYTECYLYYSCMENECDPRIRKIWESFFEQEVSHLHFAARLLRDFEGTDWQQVIPNGEFPELIALGSNIDYVRKVLAATVELTALRENYVPVSQLPDNSDYALYQGIVNTDVSSVPSHEVISRYISQFGTDYRFETQPNPIEALQNRKSDNTAVGRAAAVPVGARK